MRGLTTIDVFVNRRWGDAKEVLRGLDGDFVSRLESEQRLQTLGLDMPKAHGVGFTPKKRLSKQWHHLLEACLELTMQAWKVKVAADAMTPEANAELPPHEAGARSDYHFRSWFIHAQALTERASDVIRKTTEVYIAEATNRSEIAKRYTARVRQEISKIVDRQRNDYVHPRRSWASGITENQLWEGSVAAGVTPNKVP